ncbi:GHMP kinase [Candidatus Woesearchaeota archaeon]|nr:GHMP kinase [Candidatus Woesearchaeota archaeon]
MKKAKAFAPANISCFFRLYDSDKPEMTGSLGAGFTLDKGAVATVRLSNRTSVFVNGKKQRQKTILDVVKKLTDKNVIVDIMADVPFGAGFGMSGASALATALALNRLLGLKKTRKELGMAAHIAEVENSTGRGDVGGQFNGGIMAKFEKEPLRVERLRIRQDVIYYRVFGRINTKKVIDSREKVKRIDKAGDTALEKIKKAKDFNELIEISKEFSINSGLLRDKEVINTIDSIEAEGGKASMIMLGKSVFSNMPFRGCKKARISGRGAGLL